mgnify:CR=1 FL=1
MTKQKRKNRNEMQFFLNFNFLKQQQVHDYLLRQQTKLIIVHGIVDDRMHILSIDNGSLRNICYIIT